MLKNVLVQSILCFVSLNSFPIPWNVHLSKESSSAVFVRLNWLMTIKMRILKAKRAQHIKKDDNLSVQLYAQWWGKCFGNFLLQSSENCCHMSGVAVHLGHLGKVILFDPFASYIFLISQFNLGNSWGEKTHVCRNYSCLPEYQMIRLRNWKTVDALNFVQGHMLSVAVRIFADLPPLCSTVCTTWRLRRFFDILDFPLRCTSLRSQLSDTWMYLVWQTSDPSPNDSACFDTLLLLLHCTGFFVVLQ